MAWWDLGVRNGELEKMAEVAKRLGWRGIGVILPWKERAKLKEFKGKRLETDVALGLELSGRGFKRDIQKVRREVELIVVQGGDSDINRAAVETPEVDILARPWMGRQDCGIDYVMARLAAKNRVAIQFDFGELLHSSKRSRVQLLSQLMEAAKLVKKYRAPFVVTSGAKSPFDLRAPSDLLSFGRILGFQDPDIKKALSGWIVQENRKRLSGKWVMPGVEVASS